MLKGSVELSDFVWQTANLAGFISGCYTDDLDMIRASLAGRGHRAAAPGADSGLPRGTSRGDGGRRARLLDLGRRAFDVCLGARGCRAGGARRDAARIRAALARDRCLVRGSEYGGRAGAT